MTYFFKKPFAENGDITNIPVNPQGDGSVSYQEGWPEGYELDMQTNPDEAKNLSRTNFNGLFFNITQALQALQVYGVNPFITASDNEGEAYPYPEGGMCSYTDPATGEFGIYRSLQSNNTETPSTNGVTSALWRREFDKDLDSLKSNRISNCVLYYNNEPSYSTDSETNTITVSVYAGTKVLVPLGINNSDYTYLNNITQLVNTETVSFTFGTDFINKYFFATEQNTLLLLDSKNYSQYNSLDMVENNLDGETDYDVYYFDINANKWQYRAANTDEFIDAPVSMVLIGSFTGDSVDNVSFSFVSPMSVTSKELFDKNMSTIQPALEPSRYITLTPTPTGKHIMDVNLPSEATPFCANAGNINSSGNADLLSTQSIVIPNKRIDMITKTSGAISAGVPGSVYYTNRRSQTTIMSASSVENAFGASSGACAVWFAYNYASTVTYEIASMTFPTPISLSTLGSTLQFDVYDYGYYYHWVGYELYYAYQWFYVDVFFDDNTSITFDSRSYANWNTWTHITYNLSGQAAAGKKVTRIRIRCSGYMYNHCYGYWQYWYQVYSYIQNIRILNTINDIQYSSNQIDFKIGSNYYEKLSAAATPMITSEAGTGSTNPSKMSVMWGDSEMAEIPEYIDDFSGVYEFSSTPDETNNARLVLRYTDLKNNQILGGLAIKLTYWGDATYQVCSQVVLDRSQDLIFEIPDGKYIKKIEISASQMDYLQGVSIGKIQIYNNVPSATLSQLVQYPVLQATAANTDRTQFCIQNTPSIETNVSGYVMASASGVYILPGTNVIRKQKKRPSLSDDPALTDGDVWLDYSKEPLIAYQYYNGTWNIFNDVPIGYVTLLYGSPSASATVSGTGITSASVTASTFAQNVYGSGTYVFDYDNSKWYLGETEVSLNTYGISYSGTPAAGDAISVSYTEATATVQNLETYPYNQNGYNVNTFTTTAGSLVGRDGRDGQNGKDGKNGAPGAQGTPGIGIPTGGRTGQILAKSSNANYVTKWTDVVSNALFDGGTAGQTLIKNSSDDLDFGWGTLQALPMGGSAGEALVKNSSTDFDASWQTVQSLPSGGLPNQVLAKLSSSDYNVGWVNPGGGVSQASLRKMDFKTSAYFTASINQFRNLLLEQFIGLDGIDATDRTTVQPNYSAIDANIENLSGSSLVFKLVAMEFSEEINFMQVFADYTGTVSFRYSTDGGDTFVNFPENQILQVTTDQLILEITMAVAAVLDDVAIFTK